MYLQRIKIPSPGNEVIVVHGSANQKIEKEFAIGTAYKEQVFSLCLK
jgi:hypothetical protein